MGANWIAEQARDKVEALEKRVKKLEMQAYSVQELAKLRHVVRQKFLYGTYNRPPTHILNILSRPYNENDLVAQVEELVRTHMLAGHTAEDLLATENIPDSGLSARE